MLGGTGFYFINRKKPKEIARQSWIKYISYFIIINILFFSIVASSFWFKYLSILIVLVALFELVRVFMISGFEKLMVFLVAFLVFGTLSFGFIHFSSLKKETILFTFLVLSIFDSFSQISGQLFGRKKLLPAISPNKTLGGSIGGALVALVSSVFIRRLYSEPISVVLLTAFGIIICAFLGDLLASLYKRKFRVKDYSNLIPGHGGFLDRFDSLIAASAWVAFVHIIHF